MKYVRMLQDRLSWLHAFLSRQGFYPVALSSLLCFGFCLTRELGLGLCLAVATTDMRLAYDLLRDVGVQSFCETREIYAEICNIGTIPSGDKVVVNGMMK